MRHRGLLRTSDEELTSRLSAGEAAAFDELYRRYAARLTVFGARLLGDRAAGEDVAQIALMNAYQALRRGNEPRHVRPWLYGIARHAAFEILTRRRDVLAEPEERGTDPREADEARGALLAALDALPERQRRAYLLREVRGLKISEIAAELGLAKEQVEQALFAARNRLAEVLAFGERLDCETVLALDADTLERSERRALRGHLRACSSCRTAAGGRLGYGFAPFGFLGAIRDFAGGLLGGGAAPVAAKVGAAALAVGLAAGAPLANSAAAEPGSTESALAAAAPTLPVLGFSPGEPGALPTIFGAPPKPRTTPAPAPTPPGTGSPPAPEQGSSEPPPPEEPPAEEPVVEPDPVVDVPPDLTPPAEEPPPADEPPPPPPADDPVPVDPLVEEQPAAPAPVQ